MGAIPVAASILVSYLSAITILGYPSEVYTYGSQVFLMTLLGIVTTPIAIFIFVKVMYDLKLTSAYKYLELRYDSVVVRWLGSLIFICQLLFISGIVLYAPSIVMETMMGVPLWMSVIGVGTIGTIYTSVGGIKAFGLMFFNFS
ncbi:sodium-dependent multivitamin transporter [Folsomia candida]|uniref:sodium-dependent multivitamin transporter n=1 Tax=Folsomia candida TaxID=158441 RepID=UPI001604AABD|nr:sodium-dependent multivitamin transporter [Folsomia candida]